jgi:sugar lactone lactonase YvrE
MRVTERLRIAALVGFALGVPALGRADGPSLNFGPPHTITGGFLRPYGIAVDETHGRLLVADTANRRFRWTTIADLTGSYAFTEHGFVSDASSPNALTDPQGIAADASGNVYVVSTLKGEVKAYSWNGGNYQLSTSFCSTNPHVVNGVAIQMPRDIAVGPDGAVYLLDSGNKRVLKADGPSDTSWEVFRSDSGWSNAYGIAVDAAGALYVADTDNHRILKIVGSTTTAFGSWGTGLGQFRYPRDVAVDRHGRLFVADTYNHRVHILAADGHPIKVIGHAPGIATIDKVVVDGGDRVFVVDSDNNHVLAFLGAGAPAPVDPFVRDFAGDPGDEPSNAAYLLSSPDILVRHQPDVDLAVAAASGLETFAFQQPRHDQLNYVYVAVHNRGTQTANDNFVKVFWYDPGTAGRFPEDWSDSGFYSAYTNAAHNSPENSLHAPSIEPGGVTVVGPLIWRPPSPQSSVAGDGTFRLGARITNPFDFPPVGESLTMARDSNNVSERKVVVAQSPFPAGEQNTLVVRVHFPDLTATTDAATVESRANQLATWIQEVSWGAANVTVFHRGPITLPHASSHYASPSNNLLVEMAQDVLDALVAAEPTVLDGSGPGHEIGRIVLVTNDLGSNRDWATTGAWPYMVGGAERYLTVSVQGGDNSRHLFSHGFSHQLNLIDLYAHENVTFSRPYANGWDNMAKPFTGAHPLVWSKELATWVTSHDARVVFVPRPAPNVLWNNGGNPIGLHYQETAAPGEVIGVAFGLTHGITSFNEETAFYYVEARKNSGEGAGADSVLPQTGVVMYYANRLVPQGLGPVVLRDHVAVGDLTDAAILIGQSEAPGGTGIKMTVQAGTNGADYNLVVEYKPPESNYDVDMREGDPPWESPAIWIDNQQNGYDEDQGSESEDHGEQGIAGEENRVYARAFNWGPAAAFDVEVAYLFSEPYHTVGGQGSFDEYQSVFIDKIESGTHKKVYITWTPETGVTPHTCARVELRRMLNDTNAANDTAQRNLQIDHSVHGSPYTPIEFSFFVRNEDPTPTLVYFRVDGVPPDWSWSVSPPKALVPAGETASGVLKLTPPEGAPDCTSHKMYVTGWRPRGDTLVRLGGSSLVVNLTNKTRIDLKQRLDRCRPEDVKRASDREAKEESRKGGNAVEGFELPKPAVGKRTLPWSLRRFWPDLLLAEVQKAAAVADERDPEPSKDPRECVRIVSTGCTNPKEPNTTVSVRYEGPDGDPIYQDVQTDENGCFEDVFSTTEGGQWEEAAEFPGSECQAPARAEGTINVPLPVGVEPESTRPDAERRLCIQRRSSDVRGVVKSSRSAGVKGCDGRSNAFDQVLELELTRSRESGDAFPPIEGTLHISELRQIVSAAYKNGGFHQGRFVLSGRDLTAVGQVRGLLRRGTHHAPAAASCSEESIAPRHWELSLDGTIIEGRGAGARLHAVVALDAAGREGDAVSGDALIGALESVIENACKSSAADDERRIGEARAAAKRRWTPPCGGGLPCLAPIAKRGSGQWTLDRTGRDRCRAKGCQTYKSWGRLAVELKGVPSIEGASPVLRDGTLRMDQLIQILEKDEGGSGEHTGTFAFRTRDGVFVRGELMGLTRAGSHREPLRESCEKADAPRHFEGRMTGVILGGPAKGTVVEARYVLEMENRKGRRRKVSMTIEGWGIRGCVAGSETRDAEPGETTPGVSTPRPPPTRRTGNRIRFVEKLPDKFFRPLSALPPAAVSRITAIEGGRMTPEIERKLRLWDRRFRELDRDGQGSLSKAEFEAILNPPRGRPQPGAAKPGTKFAESALRVHDKNRDGIVERPEAGNGWKTLGLLDLNRDDKLVRSELEKGPEAFAARDFSDADTDRNGAIDFTEYAVRQHRNASRYQLRVQSPR